ncbi:uncharacterized protein N7477_009042 [Penicillium maclennaniae]|uniref:uncharacterized protein n=1 Tax=Penicillium maclennaniae TaxID=1343394 RepID=UPI00254022C0|nr:uncharacterized protein N7477_009042 [Penicillium maclennaniae]KAJ5661426.1 hypothetical protein N7477_009042 [Penicillium maclennaniae]
MASVTNGASTRGTLGVAALAIPVVSLVNPTTGPTAGGNTVSIIGSGFINATAVTFGSAAATSYTVVSATTINAVVPAGPSGGGSVSVRVTSPGGTSAAGTTYTYIAAPVVSNVSPTTGPAAGGNTVSIIGSGFTNATAVTFGSAAATSYTVVSATTINAVVPAGPSGGGSVSVPAPVVSSVSPTTGPAAGGNTVSIIGSGFTNATAVTFGSAAATSFTVVSATTINAVVPAGPSGGGSVSVRVTSPGGTSAAGTTYTYIAAPVVSSVSPTTGPAAGGNTVSIIGSGFNNATAVTFGATPATSFTVVSATAINAVVPPRPERRRLVSPTTGPAAGGNTVSIIGSGFTNATAVTFGSAIATLFTVLADTVINAVAPPGPSGGGSVSVRVTSPGGTSAAGTTYTYIAAPVVSSVSPTTGPAAGGNTVSIIGSGFTNATAVTFGATPATSFTVVSATAINAVVPPRPERRRLVNPTTGPAAGGNTVSIIGSGFTNATAVTFGSAIATSFTVLADTVINAVAPPGPSGGGSVSVRITSPGGTSSASINYTYAAALTPIITALIPASGPVSGGNNVTITGSNLSGATAVTFAGNPASSFTILSPTQVNAVAPPGTAGTASVVVTTPAGASTGFNYTYVAAPTPTAVYPTAAVTAGGNTVAIVGTNLLGTTGVKFGTTPAASFTVIDDTEVDAVTPPHNVGTVSINITTPGGTDSSLSFSFQPLPVIASITPTSGPTAGGTTVTITGAGLINTLDVFFGTTAATAFTVISDNTVTATSPAGAVGATAVTVDTASATSNGAIFQYIAAPTLTTLSPTGGAIAGGNNVTLTGTGFTTATNVFFGANPAPFTIHSDNSISAVAPSGTGAVSVTVVNPGGTSGAQTYSYS